MLLDKIQFEEKHKDRTSFWATDCEKPLFDLYHSWMGTKPTNPIEVQTLFMFEVGKMVELALVNKLQEVGELKKFDNDEQQRIEMEREGVPISGYIDAIKTDGTPVEIKTYYGTYQDKDLENGIARTSYLKQLAVYMDFLDVNSGTLIYVERGTGKSFEFILTREGTIFTCNDISFDMMEVYKRWAKLYTENVLPKVEIKSEYRYKIPVEDVDWKSIPKHKVSKARNGGLVIGDHPWAVQYSDYKNLLIEREGTTLGYTDSEIEKIVELTKGHSTWK